MILTKHNLICYYQNVRGLRLNTLQVQKKIFQNSYDIIIFTETWLNNSFYDTEIFDNRYNVYRRDRESSLICSSKERGGGVLIAVLKKYLSRRINEWESNCEDVWTQIILNKSQVLNFCAVYLPPPVSLSILDNYLVKSCGACAGNGETIIVGDFNLGGIIWNADVDGHDYSLPTGYDNCSLNGSLFDFISLNNLVQLNHVSNSGNRILDLVLCSMSDNIKVSECPKPLRSIDKHHPPLNIEIEITTVPNKPRNSNIEPKPNFHKADYDAIKLQLGNLDWNFLYEQCVDVNSMVRIFYEHMNRIVRECIPLSYKSKFNKYPVWFSSALINLLKLKYKYHVKYKKYKNRLDKIEFDYLREDCDGLMRECYSNYIKSIERLIISNPKFFWTNLVAVELLVKEFVQGSTATIPISAAKQ